MTRTIEQRKYIDALFRRALEQPEANRRDWLEAQCGADASLRDAVTGLLDASGADGFLREGGAMEGAIWEDFCDTVGGEESLVGKRVGAYRIVREIGRGGMSVVYLAERADGEFEQQVALKLIRPGFDTEEILQRFTQERQILAGLIHPGIAQLLDGGSTADGRPYFVLQLIDGQTIDRYCADRRFDVDRRLDLFLCVAEAVQFAHNRLVIHRDIKPSNILVTPDGQPKLLDFGIAKMLDPYATPEQPALTQTALNPHTPQFASPEQINGEIVTTASDVYQLGHLLYRLLTGVDPYDTGQTSQSPRSEVVSLTEPVAPSKQVLPRMRQGVGDNDGLPVHGLHTRLRGDLDNILLKALRKEPERRYGTVQEFADDVRRHLDGLPVRARPDTFAYRSSKFVRRHRLGLIAATLVFSALLVGLLAATWQTRIATTQALRAEKTRDLALSLFEITDPNVAQGGDIPVRVLLAQGERRVDTELAAHPDLQADMRLALGNLYLRIGDYPNAGRLLTAALDQRQTMATPNGLSIAEALVALGEFGVASSDYAMAERRLTEALAIYRNPSEESPAQVARVLNALGELKFRQDELDAAGTYLDEALRLRIEARGPDHVDVAASLGLLGMRAHRADDFAAAEGHYRKALAIYRATYGEEHDKVATTLQSLAVLLHRYGRYDEAELNYRAALELQTKLYGDEHPQLVSLHNSLGSLLRMSGDYVGAEPVFERGVTLARKLLGAHPRTAALLTNYAHLLSAINRPADAVKLYREAAGMNRSINDGAHASVANAMSGEAHVYLEYERYSEAAALFEAAVAVMEESLGKSHSWVAILLNHLGNAQIALGEVAAAEQALARAWQINDTALPDGHIDRARTLVAMGRLERARGNGQSVARFRDALTIRLAALPDDHRDVAEVRAELGGTLLAMGRTEDAEPLILAGHAHLADAPPRLRRLALETMIALAIAQGRGGEIRHLQAQVADLTASAWSDPVH